MNGLNETKQQNNMDRLRIKMRIKRLEGSFLRDRWGNLTECYWNDMIKEDIVKLESQLK